MSDPIKFTCPSCDAHHERGYHMGTLGLFRCLRCGYVGHGHHPDAEIIALIDDEIQATPTRTPEPAVENICATAQGRGEPVETLSSGLSSAELCRRNGWSAGAVLRGTESGVDLRGRPWSSAETITITAVGKTMVLAKCDKHDREMVWSLRERSWHEVPPDSGQETGARP